MKKAYLVYALFLLVFGLTFSPILDERSYQVAAMELAGESIDADVPVVATPPLPVIIFAAIGKLIGFDLWKLRLVSLAASIAMLYFFSKISKNALLLLLYPYTLLLSFTAQTDILALSFFVISLYFFEKEDYIATSVFTTLAIYTRQTYLFIVPAYLSIYLMKKKLSKEIIYLALPFILFLPMIILWKGYLPPEYVDAAIARDFHSVGLHVEKLLFFLSVVGVFFFPAITNVRLKKYDALFIIPIALVSFIPFTCEGILCHAFTNPLGQLLMAVTAFLGLLYLIQRFDRYTVILGWWMLMMLFTSNTRQRYFLPAIPLLTIMLYRKVDRKYIMLWTLVLFMTAFAYSFAKVIL